MKPGRMGQLNPLPPHLTKGVGRLVVHTNVVAFSALAIRTRASPYGLIRAKTR